VYINRDGCLLSKQASRRCSGKTQEAVVPEISELEIARHVERLFSEIATPRGRTCETPVTGDQFVYKVDRTKPQKDKACRALRARVWFASNGPTDAPPLPLTCEEREDYKWRRRPLDYIIAQYARSLEGSRYDVAKHPSLSDFASGLLWDHDNGGSPLHFSPEVLAELKGRFPPRKLEGLEAYYWSPPRRVRRTRLI
jgi:hypothetical protein